MKNVGGTARHQVELSDRNLQSFFKVPACLYVFTFNSYSVREEICQSIFLEKNKEIIQKSIF